MGLKSTTHGVTVAISLAGLRDPAPILRAVMDKVQGNNNNARAALCAGSARILETPLYSKPNSWRI